MESALIGCPTVGIVRFNFDCLSSKSLRIRLSGIISVGFSIDRSAACDCVMDFFPILKHKDRQLVQGRGEFKVYNKKIHFSHQFTVRSNSVYW